VSDASTLFDFSKLKDIDKQSQGNADQLQTLLEQNNLYRKKLPDGPKSLLRAISDTLYFTSHYCDQIQQFLFKQLSHLITTDKLPPRLNMFRGNSMLLKDYTTSPHLSGFDKINLELVSSLFKVKIVVYSVTEDNYLNAIIVNNYHEKTIELVRGKNNNYEPVFSKKYIDKIGAAQNVILNIIDQVAEGKPSVSSMKDLNGDSYVNFDYLKWLSTHRQENNLNQFRITRGQHKKSFSDTFSKLLDTKDDQQMKLYDMFTNTKPPEDFLKLLRQRKDTAGSDFSINATLDFMDEPWGENPAKSKDASIARPYHLHPPGIQSTPRTTSLKEDTTFSQGLRSRTSVQNPGYFQDTVNISGIEKIDDNAVRDTSMMSPIHYIRTPPPGLTPTRYLQKSFTYSENPGSNADIINSSPTFQRNDGGLTPNSVYGQRSPARHGFSAFSGQEISPQHRPVINNLYNKRTGNSEGLLIPVSTDTPYQLGPAEMEQLSASKEKKKPIILDESKERYTGRLKFFDEAKNYGFIIMDDDGSDIFVHMDDLMKANIPKETLRTIKNGNMIRLSFCCMSYIGKYKKSRKAIEIIILE